MKMVIKIKVGGTVNVSRLVEIILKSRREERTIFYMGVKSLSSRQRFKTVRLMAIRNGSN